MGEPLYTAKTACTKNEYMRFNVAMIRYVSRAYIPAAIVCALVFVCGVLIARNDGIGKGILYGLVMAVLFAVVYILVIWIGINRAWKSNPLAQDSMTEYSFYDDRVETKTSFAESKVPYDKFYRFLETDDGFYLMTAQNAGMIISKAICSDELKTFLREKAKVTVYGQKKS